MRSARKYITIAEVCVLAIHEELEKLEDALIKKIAEFRPYLQVRSENKRNSEEIMRFSRFQDLGQARLRKWG